MAQQSNDVFEFLKQDHRQIEQMLNDLESCSPDQRDQLFQEFKQHLVAHSKAEEQAFYPKFRDQDQTHDLVEDGLNEHQKIDEMLTKMEGIGSDSNTFDQTLKELKQCLLHHVHDEEDKMFPKARQMTSDDDAEAIGKRVRSIEEGQLRH